MPTTTHPYSCPTARIRVTVTKQTFPAIAGIGDDASHSQSDYDCSHQATCEHRHDQACAVFRLNTGVLGSQR